MLIQHRDVADSGQLSRDVGPGDQGAEPSRAEAPRAGDVTAGRDEFRQRRYWQLRHAESRLRPLRDTRFASTYWRVHDEFRRLGRELGREGLEEQPRA